MDLSSIQLWLKKHKINAYYLTRNNMFLEEDILPEENKICELTGFSGSAGNLIITPEQAFLFVDGRYELQASLETDQTKVTVLCTASASPLNWLISQFAAGKNRIMYDPWCISSQQLHFLQNKLYKAKFIPDKQQILGSRLSAKTANVFSLEEKYTGIGSDEKISTLVASMQKYNLDAYLITNAHQISWLLNLRSDILPDSPIMRAYALIKKDSSLQLFAENVAYPNILPLSKLGKYLKKIRKGYLGISDKPFPQIINELYGAENLHLVPDLLEMQQAVKNPVELQGFKSAHCRDAVAMIKFLYWLEHNWQHLTELDIVAKINSLRQEQNLYYSRSFETIAGTGSNAAIIHYQPTPQSNTELIANSVLLLDSGAHYYDGTTDITRTLALGNPSTQIVNDNTLVLKAHIALASTYFPEKTEGKVLDGICRQVLWNEGKNFAHGTGHGVGFMLNVHEGPQSISVGDNKYGFVPNMVTSIEPGYYKAENYGIRIENLYYVVASSNPEFDNPMLHFEPLTLVPLDKRLINKYLLTDNEINWLNTYHHQVYQTISPLLDKELSTWLKEMCSPL